MAGGLWAGNEAYGVVDGRNLLASVLLGSKAIGPIAQFRLERTPDKREVVGSIPTRPTITRPKNGLKEDLRASNKRRGAGDADGRLEFGGVAQLGEHLPCTQEAIGSNPFTSTTQTTDLMSDGDRRF